MPERRYWLLKTEPDCFSIADLAKCPKRTTHWDGVRNYQARNFIRDDMHKGDGVLLYHSSTKPQAVVGTATIVRAAYPDFTAMVASDQHYDPKSTPENPVWYMVDIKLDQTFAQPLTLEQLKGQKELTGMELLRRGSRLSVQPVTKGQFEAVLRLAQGAATQGAAPAVESKGAAKSAGKPTSGKGNGAQRRTK